MREGSLWISVPPGAEISSAGKMSGNEIDRQQNEFTKRLAFGRSFDRHSACVLAGLSSGQQRRVVRMCSNNLYFSKSSVPCRFRNKVSKERLGQIRGRCLWDFSPISRSRRLGGECRLDRLALHTPGTPSFSQGVRKSIRAPALPVALRALPVLEREDS